MDTRIEPRRAAWRMLSIGSTIWAPLGEHGWRPEIITGLGKNRRDCTRHASSFREWWQRTALCFATLLAQAGAERTSGRNC
jgi:hypothetical protein